MQLAKGRHANANGRTPLYLIYLFRQQSVQIPVRVKVLSDVHPGVFFVFKKGRAGVSVTSVECVFDVFIACPLSDHFWSHYPTMVDTQVAALHIDPALHIHVCIISKLSTVALSTLIFASQTSRHNLMY